MTGVYNSDGSVDITVVDGTTWTGLYASDGSVNAVLNDYTYTGLYHPCGALRVNSSDGDTITDHSGAYYRNTIFGGLATSRASDFADYNPVTALGSKLIAYWDANRGDTFLFANNTNAVNHWYDIVAGYDAASPDLILTPFYQPTGLAGAPSVYFDTTGYLTCTTAGLLAALPSGATPSETWAVVSQDGLVADTTTRYITGWSGTSVTTGRAISRVVTTAVNRARGYTGDGSAAQQANLTSVDFSGVHVIRHQVGATTSSLDVDSSTAATVSVVPSTTVSRLRIGSIPASGASNNWNGYISAILITQPLTAGEATALHAYLG